jgi:hypothetical protein
VKIVVLLSAYLARSTPHDDLHDRQLDLRA